MGNDVEFATRIFDLEVRCDELEADCHDLNFTIEKLVNLIETLHPIRTDQNCFKCGKNRHAQRGAPNQYTCLGCGLRWDDER